MRHKYVSGALFAAALRNALLPYTLVLAACAVTAGAADAQLAYDESARLNARLIGQVDSAGFSRDKIVFDGGAGSRVPALVAIPKNGPARHPVIVLVDGIGGWKERWWTPTSWNRGRILIDSLLAAGFAVAMADAPASGERTFENDFVTAESFVKDLPKWRNMGVKNAVETRRLIDYLVSRPDVDSARIGILGLSHGGMMTFALTAVDSRIKVAVAGLTPLKNIPDVLMPPLYAPLVRVPMLMLAGRTDAWYSAEQVDAAFRSIASKDKKLVWYDVGHRVPEAYAGEATRWFQHVLR
jgi:dienelactone hydrolase